MLKVSLNSLDPEIDTRSNSLIRKGHKGVFPIFDGVFLKTKGFLQKVYEIFGE